MKIQAVTKYNFDGVEYNSLKEIQSKVHDIIGEEVLDQINRKIDIRHKDLLPLLDLLCSKEIRNVLMKCYNVVYETNKYDAENGEYEVEVKNILDLK